MNAEVGSPCGIMNTVSIHGKVSLLQTAEYLGEISKYMFLSTRGNYVTSILKPDPVTVRKFVNLLCG
ncbi:hypothetical protein FHU10_4613 [Serratia fonticola]|uniref:Uncharacterized protein n=1 Tax=Serratia fonticola TaxID=47917 RepID=A0A542BPT1_SERFO|nr:hypothetical protein FHU09_3092 [Serratia fonticola]TQI97458.1 hypothetical protein FHU11_2953 [Serratia fonticola]TVZ71955.1 hypothetical protein FHU10_4613 [Serratia fonticola]